MSAVTAVNAPGMGTDERSVSPGVDRRVPTLMWKPVLSALGILFNLWVATQTNHANLSSDFIQFYAAGKLAGTGHLYDRQAMVAIEARYGAPGFLTGRLPVVALTFKPLSVLPFAIARKVWLTASILAGILALLLWPDVDRAAMLIALCWSLPACFTLFYGQEVLFWLLLFASGLYLLRRGHCYAAGITFALCICKFHLLIGLGVMLLARREWKTIFGGILSTAFLLMMCFALEGPTWPTLYGANMRLPEFSPATNRMPDVYGLVARFPHGLMLEILLSAVIASALWFACRRTSLTVAGALASATGLLMAHHSQGYDCLLLLPLCVIVAREGRLPEWIRLAAVLLLSPVLLFTLASDYSIIAQLLVCVFVIAALILSPAIQLSLTHDRQERLSTSE
ncbi:MAG: DUF2029 domain-containing protein [Acidobacteriaceae bacterium]|nr:DUF2029 domain-containing protein [Acidobacteriaceae bacterium]